MEPQADIIRSISIFSALSREDIAKVLGKLEEITFSAGTTIVKQGDQGDAFYLIQSGTVQVVVDSGAGNSEIIAVLGTSACLTRDGDAERHYGDETPGVAFGPTNFSRKYVAEERPRWRAVDSRRALALHRPGAWPMQPPRQCSLYINGWQSWPRSNPARSRCSACISICCRTGPVESTGCSSDRCRTSIRWRR